MKKLISLLIIAALMLGTLIAFAGGGDGGQDVFAPADPETEPSQIVSPHIDCDHTYGTVKRHFTEQQGCLRYVEYDEISCVECGTLLRTTNVKYGTNTKYTGGKVLGDIYRDGDEWYRDVYCKGCGAYLYTNMVTDLNFSGPTTIPAI